MEGGDTDGLRPDTGAGVAPGFVDASGSLLHLLQQQAALAHPNQQQQQQQRAMDPDASFTALLQQQQQQQAGVGPPPWAAFSLPLTGFAGQQPRGAYGAQQVEGGVYGGQQGMFGAQPMAFGGAAADPSTLYAPASAGGGQLPPAILQHQQAALARQAHQAAGLGLPPMPAASAASTGYAGDPLGGGVAPQQPPSWAVLQQQAAVLPVVSLPGMGLPLPLPDGGQLQGGGAQQAAGWAPMQQDAPPPTAAAQPAPKRRGRQPKDPSTLTEKQLRAREAQKRFRDKQKKQMAETEAALGDTSAELDRLRISNESQKLKNEVLERLLQYKEASVNALEFQKQMDPPPRFVISPDMVDMMRREGIAGLFTPEVLLRYSVAGYTEHMDERGEVKDPPPFDKVAEDWSEIVEHVRRILDAARQDGPAARGAAPAAPPPMPADGGADGGRPARAARPSELVELHSGASGDSVGGPPARPDSRATGSTDGSTSFQAGRQDEVAMPERRVSFDAPEMRRPPPASTAGTAGPGQGGASAASGGGAAGKGGAEGRRASSAATGGSGAGSSGSARRSNTRVPEHINPEFVAIADEATDEVLEVAEAKDDPIARFVLARILSQTAAHSHLHWDTLVDGAAVEDGPNVYRFTGQQLRALAQLMRRVGLMLWQQALLFPHHITKLGTLRLDDPNNLRVEEQDLEHWRDILRRLYCRPEQLHKIMVGHQRYMERMAPVLEERREALHEVQRMTAMQMQHAFSTNNQSTQLDVQSFVQCTTRLTEATGLVMQTVSAQHAAYCELLIAIFYALTFPVQRPQLFVLSWPYFPQLELIGRAAALELGMDISSYPTYSSDAAALHT